ncbi:SRPBCC domain-containing protein [Inquilinus sp. Marseille-Q2685]|uniref:SRPBCC family protein n=1 Tax=Inquilinus sp. Marseille-Q2685 TaxID=2866581 RepID=UPI001CE475AA|nr:SRPBCC domain-containing protein [Inquilinus sp. Marseille-Q2685]
MSDPKPDDTRSPADIVVDCDLEHPPEKVWRALTEPELLAAWLLPNDIAAGGGRRFTPRGGAGTDRPIDCEVLAAEPPRLLRYSWRGREADAGGRALETGVTFTLDGTAAGGTRLRIVHSGFRAGARATALWTGTAAPRRSAGRRAAARPLVKASAAGGRLRWAA